MSFHSVFFFVPNFYGGRIRGARAHRFSVAEVLTLISPATILFRASGSSYIKFTGNTTMKETYILSHTIRLTISKEQARIIKNILLACQNADLSHFIGKDDTLSDKLTETLENAISELNFLARLGGEQ